MAEIWFPFKAWHQSLINHFLSSLLMLNILLCLFLTLCFISINILLAFSLQSTNVFLLMSLSFLPYSTLLLQVTPCSTVWWLWQDAAPWGRCRIRRCSESRRQTLYRWRMIQEMRTGSLKWERFWTQDTSTLPGPPLEPAWTWVSMHIAGS